jgi:membrane fusion protein (multidrug efflux system)
MRTVHPGQYLAEGTSIVMLAEITDDIYLDFAVPQEYAVRVKPGTVVTASSRVLGQNDAKITVISMDATVNPTTRNVRVRSSVADPEHRLKQGMFIDVEVPVEAPKEFVAIPNTAIRRAAFGDHVFVLTPGEAPPAMVAKMRMVTIGPDLGGKVIITSGLTAGEKIAAAGSFKLREGAVVMQAKPKDGAPGGAPAEGSGAPGAPKSDPKKDGLAANSK